MSRTPDAASERDPSGRQIDLEGRADADRAEFREDVEAPALPTDQALVERVRWGDDRAFERLVRRHLRQAHAVARSKLGGNDADADDVVQEAFITALERIDQCRDPEHFRAWFLSIVRNRAHNRREYLAVRQGVPLEHARDVSTDDDPSRRAEESELQRELEAAMSDMTELQRTTFRLYDLEGWDHGEISARLGISRGGSRFHLHQARKILRERLTTYPLAWRR